MLGNLVKLENDYSRARAFEARLAAIRRRVRSLKPALRPIPTMLSFKEAAEEAGVPIRAIKHLVECGRVASKNVSGKRLIPRSELRHIKKKR